MQAWQTQWEYNTICTHGTKLKRKPSRVTCIFNTWSIMVDYRSSFIVVLWISLLSSSLHEAWCLPKEAFPSHKNGVAASSPNFMVVGDWGGQDDPPYYTDPEQDVAKQMGDIAANMGAQFTLSMGDNFYDNELLMWTTLALRKPSRYANF